MGELKDDSGHKENTDTPLFKAFMNVFLKHYHRNSNEFLVIASILNALTFMVTTRQRGFILMTLLRFRID